MAAAPGNRWIGILLLVLLGGMAMLFVHGIVSTASEKAAAAQGAASQREGTERSAAALQNGTAQSTPAAGAAHDGTPQPGNGTAVASTGTGAASPVTATGAAVYRGLM